MNSVTISMVVVPAVVALLLFLVFTYLYEQTRQDYFRAWQLGWGAYTLHYVLDAWSIFRSPSAVISLLASLLLAAMALCIFISTRLMRERFRFRWYDGVVGAAGAALSLWNLKEHMVGGVFHPELLAPPNFRLEVGVALVLLYCSFYFYRYAHRKNSLAFTLLAMSLALWSVLMLFGQFSNSYVQLFDLLGPIPQLSLGIAMVMVLAENERNAVQENALAFSTLGVDPTRLLSADDLVPSMQSILDRLVAPLAGGWSGDLHVGALARGSAFGAAWLFSGLPGKPGEERRRRIRLRTGLPAGRIRHLPRRAGDARAVAGFSRRTLSAIPPGADGRTHLQRHRREPADAGAQFRSDSVPACGAPDVRFVESAPADRAGAADRPDAGKLCGHARRAAPHQGVRAADPDRTGHQFTAGSGRDSADSAKGTGTDFRHQRLLHRVSGRRRDPLRTGSGEGRDIAQALAQGRQWFERVHDSQRAAAVDPLGTGKDARAAGRHLSCRRGRPSVFAAHPSCWAADRPE